MKNCHLCLIKISKFVKSHIIPQGFYEEFKKTPLIGISANAYDKKYQNGIYGEFLCDSCEMRFNEFDEFIISVLKQGKQQKLLHYSDDATALVIENIHESKNKLHKFALSVLWRAACSNRNEYRNIRLGAYQEKIRCALNTNAFSDELLNQTGVCFREFRGGDEMFNSAFVPYHLHKKSSHFKQVYGNFHCHDFGFPYGELMIRLGGEKPKQGFFDVQLHGFSGKAVVWSCNLSTDYPNWFVSRSPQLEEKVQLFDDVMRLNSQFRQNKVASVINR